MTEADEGEYRCAVENFAGTTTNASAILTVLPVPRPTLQLLQLGTGVRPATSGRLIGAAYQLQVSGEMSTWTNYGAPFTATSNTMVYPNSFDVGNWNSLYFRLRAVP